MSATLGPTARFEEDLLARTGREAVTVSSDVRPVPLEFGYQNTPIHESVESLLESGRAPVYVVYFTQKSASGSRASVHEPVDLFKGGERQQSVRRSEGSDSTPRSAKDLKRFLSHGIGIHHAGMLPKYRLLIEKLAQKSLLKVIVGTDTLGVGVNIPIRTVLLTQLFKYDGIRVRILTVREFQQIAGRAGRKGSTIRARSGCRHRRMWSRTSKPSVGRPTTRRGRRRLRRRRRPTVTTLTGVRTRSTSW